MRLAVSEALTNIIMHAYLGRDPGSMIAGGAVRGSSLVISVSDDGRRLVPRSDSPGLAWGFRSSPRTADDFRVGKREAAPGTVVFLRFSLR